MNNNFGNNIRKYREDMHMSQNKFAEKINAVLGEHGKRVDYTNRSVSKWENGDSLPSLEVVIVLSQMIGVSLDELFREEITEFKKCAVQHETKNDFMYYREPDGWCYNEKYLFIMEAIKNIYESHTTPYGILHASTVILQRTNFPSASRLLCGEHAEKIMKNPSSLPLAEGEEIDEESNLTNYWESFYEKGAKKTVKVDYGFGEEIISLGDLLKQEWLRGNAASVLFDNDVCYKGRFLKEGEPPFFDGYEECSTAQWKSVLQDAYTNIANPSGLLFSAVKAQRFSSENARLKKLFAEEAPFQLSERIHFFSQFTEFKSVATAYFIHEGRVYAKHSIKIEMPTSEFEKTYKEYVSFVGEVPFQKDINTTEN